MAEIFLSWCSIKVVQNTLIPCRTLATKRKSFQHLFIQNRMAYSFDAEHMALSNYSFMFPCFWSVALKHQFDFDWWTVCQSTVDICTWRMFWPKLMLTQKIIIQWYSVNLCWQTQMCTCSQIELFSNLADNNKVGVREMG